MQIRSLNIFLAHLAVMVLFMIAECTNFVFEKCMIPIFTIAKREFCTSIINAFRAQSNSVGGVLNAIHGRWFESRSGHDNFLFSLPMIIS